jgi:2-hydroxy-3-keto-5-methylthiopentenyl-1-phosphate phosphatase
MLPVGAVLVDFDGTACLHDVAEHLLIEFGDDTWPAYDAAVDRGEIGLREAIQAQDATIHADRGTLLAFALEHCPIDPTFAPFCEWLASRDVPVALVSDGFGFYIGPILEAAGLGHLTVITNEQRWDASRRPAGMDFVSGHPRCVGCGTCKMQAVQRHQAEHGLTVFVGEGQTDRYGALYADLVFAKDALPDYCRADGVPFVEWNDFGDIRGALEATSEAPGPVAPIQCPGWTLPTD